MLCQCAVEDSVDKTKVFGLSRNQLALLKSHSIAVKYGHQQVLEAFHSTKEDRLKSHLVSRGFFFSATVSHSLPKPPKLSSICSSASLKVAKKLFSTLQLDQSRRQQNRIGGRNEACSISDWEVRKNRVWGLRLQEKLQSHAFQVLRKRPLLT